MVGLSIVDIATLCLAAYLEPEARDRLAAVVGVEVAESVTGEITAFVSHGPVSDQIIFRGADDYIDDLECAELWPLAWGNGQVPYGMGHPLAKAWPRLKAALRPGVPTDIGGHSLGGGHAHQSGLFVDARIISFGAPRCWQGPKGALGRNHTRYVHALDPVPTEPPFWEHYASEAIWLRPQKGEVGPWIPPEGLSLRHRDDHAIALYIAALAATQPR